MTRAAITVKFLPMVENEIKHPEFAERLNAAMHNASVSVTDLKNHLKITYEMARRYTMGVAMPRDDKLIAIALYLGVQTAWLKFGDAISIPKIERTHTSVTDANKALTWPFSPKLLKKVAALTDDQRGELEVEMHHRIEMMLERERRLKELHAEQAKNQSA